MQLKRALAFGMFTLFLISLVSVNVAAFQDPHPIHGVLEDGDGNEISDVMVTATNLRTGESWEDRTSATGEFSIELLNLPSGYSEGDEIEVTAEYDGEVASEIVTIHSGNLGTRVDLILGVPEGELTAQMTSFLLLILVVIVVLVIILIIIVNREKGK